MPSSSYCRRVLGESDTFGEMAFFTEIPQIESVHSLTVSKVLTIARADYASVAASFPLGASTVLANLCDLTEQVCGAEAPLVPLY